MTRCLGAACALGVALLASATASAAESTADGVYDRFDGDLDVGLAAGVELGSAGDPAFAMRASAHYFAIAGVYAQGRLQTGGDSAPSLLALGIDFRPLFVPRWSKGYETGPGVLDLTLDSLSLNLGGFWANRDTPGKGPRGLEVGLGFGMPLFARASGPWLEARGLLRYPDSERREEAVLLALSWHGFVTTPLSNH